MKRGSGILMHITSLSSPYGIGDMGPGAFKFADFLAESGQTFWQVLPLSPTDPGQGNSPYSSASAFAFSPLLISPDFLLRDGFLSDDDLHPLPYGEPERVDYPAVTAYKGRLLNTAYERFRHFEDKHEFEGFRAANDHWLDNFAIFTALKERDSERVWSDWPEELRDRRPETMEAIRAELSDAVERIEFIQFLAFRQWHALKSYCNERGISIVGDIPIYVSYDGADVWSNSGIFKLDDNKKPTHVSGVPPDYFSSTGQLWGNPVYNWEVCRQSEFHWWRRRMGHILSLFDIVRIDHLRGLVAYWEVPAGAETAENGVWVDVPSREFFDALIREHPQFPIIAEDLGLMTPEVQAIMDHYRFPGMKVLLFAFGDDDPDQAYLPHNYPRNSVVYTGTHDNDTARGWYEHIASPEDRARVGRYINREVTADTISWELIQLAMQSIADMAIIPMQDLLGLGQEARMNLPGKKDDNWQWRIHPDQLHPELLASLGKITRTYSRI